MAAQEARFILCNVGARARRQDRNLLLDLLDIIIARFEIDLRETHPVSIDICRGRLKTTHHTCLIATISPVVLSIALYTVPKLPPVKRFNQHDQCFSNIPQPANSLPSSSIIWYWLALSDLSAIVSRGAQRNDNHHKTHTKTKNRRTASKLAALGERGGGWSSW